MLIGKRKKQAKAKPVDESDRPKESVLQQFQGLDVNQIGLWPFGPRLVVYFIIALLVLVLAWLLILNGKYAEYENIKLRQNALEQDFVETMTRVKGSNLEKELEMTQSHVALLEARLPDEANMASLLESINRAGVDSQLDVKKLRAEPLIKREYYAEQPIFISIEGESYHDFGRFAEALAALERIVTLDNIVLAPADINAGERRGMLGVKLEGTLKTYRYLADDEQRSQK